MSGQCKDGVSLINEWIGAKLKFVVIDSFICTRDKYISVIKVKSLFFTQTQMHSVLIVKKLKPWRYMKIITEELLSSISLV